jgi:hypothetical protein
VDARSHSGGVKVPEAVRDRTRQRILLRAERRYKGKYTRLDVRFRGPCCCVDGKACPTKSKSPGGATEDHDAICRPLRGLMMLMSDAYPGPRPWASLVCRYAAHDVHVRHLVQPLRGWSVFWGVPFGRLHQRLFTFVPFRDRRARRPRPEGPRLAGTIALLTLTHEEHWRTSRQWHLASGTWRPRPGHPDRQGPARNADDSSTHL